MAQKSIHTGYLVLADISGFTGFVAGSEIAHAQSIHSGLIDHLRGLLTPTLALAEVEGDALFLFAPDRKVKGETIIELIESTYVAFTDRIRGMQRNAVCPCQACRMIPSLDLKFITHWGEYVLQNLQGSTKPFGSCVNLAHRLLKNEITAHTGWPAYALFTDRAIDRMGVRPMGMHEEQVEYAHLGSCVVSALDLKSRYGELTAERRSFVSQRDAHFVLQRRYPLPRPLLWELLTDIDKRNTWEFNADWSERDRPTGRPGPGATNHCAASDFLEELLDWRPFDYFTTRLSYRSLRFRITGEMLDNGTDTELHWRMALESLVPTPLRGPACRFFAKRLMKAPARFRKLDEVILREASAPEPEIAVPA